MARDPKDGTANTDGANADQTNANAGGTPEGGAPAAAAAPAGDAATASDERYKMVTPPATKNPDGTETPSAPVKRVDYIRDLWARKMSRGDIARHLTQITGKKVPYQIVFAATKGIQGGPDKSAAGEVVVPPAPPASGTAAA